MNIRVLNSVGNRIVLDPQLKSALESLGREAEKPDANWQEISQKMLRVLERDGFDVSKLQSEIEYADTKKGKEIIRINFYHAAQPTGRV